MTCGCLSSKPAVMTDRDNPSGAGATAPFDLNRPDKQTLPLVLASPHSGRAYSDEFIAASRLDALSLRRSEDAYVDEVYALAPEAGAPLLCANFPRAFVDPNREAWELDPTMFADALPPHAQTRSERVRAGFGTIPRFVADGAEIYTGQLKADEARERIEALYFPYHEALKTLVEGTRKEYGICVLLDCHSMPSIGGPSDRDAGRKRKDIILGDRYGASCAPALVAQAEEVFAGLGLSTARNDPYAGAFTTEHYGQPASGVHTIQIELNRGLYLNERRIEVSPGLEPLRTTMKAFVARFGAAVLAQ